jgi:D-alanyl-D-alanine carboxypeptidase (penicillin-binding protein 5/6)
MDAATGTVLYSAGSDLVIPPASLAKLMTIHLALRETKAGGKSLDGLVDLPPESWAENQPPRSSLMFLGRGQKVTLGEILLGMAVPSGNDAAVAAALYLAPDMKHFVSRMNAEAERLGMGSTRFTEPSGISAENATTAMDFALFCRAYLQEHPESLGFLHSSPLFAYPLAAHTGSIPPRTILQYNHNGLLDTGSGGVPGVDGLKTGHIREAGYNIALSAKRGETRLIAVILGSKTEGDRSRDGEALLEWGFANFKTRYFEAAPLPRIRIWGGGEKYAALKAASAPVCTVSVYRAGEPEQAAELSTGLWAPLPAGAWAGVLVIRDETGEILRVSLVLEKEAERGTIFRRILDRIGFFIKKLLDR